MGLGGRRAGLTTLVPSCVDCLELFEIQPLVHVDLSMPL